MITSVGYAGTVDDAQWARWAPHLGVRLWVAGPGDLAPSVTSASARQVQVAAGTAGGSGIMDVLDAAESVTLSPLASGSRVDVVCLRRSWTPTGTPTGTTSVVVVSGTSLTAALAALRRSPGTIEGDDQPVAAFQVAASGGSASVSLLADLRLWGASGGLVARSTDALVVVDDPGTTVTVDGVLWVRAVGASGAASWVRLAGVDTTVPALTLGQAASAVSDVTCRRSGGLAWLGLNFVSAHSRQAGSLDLGWVLFYLPAGFRPPRRTAFATAHGLHGEIDPTGWVAIQYNGPPVAAGSHYTFSAVYALA